MQADAHAERVIAPAPARRPRRGRRLLLATGLAGAICLGVLVATSVFDRTKSPPKLPAAASAPPARPGYDPVTSLAGTAGEISALEARLAIHPNDADVLSQLGIAYLQRAREQGDPALYQRADALLGRALAADPKNLDAILGNGVLALARHDFRRGLTIGQQALALTNGTSSAALGVVGDAQIELGQYGAAQATFQQMVDERPGLASYARLSYAYELEGNLPDAVRLMRAAAQAGAGSPENTAWVNVQLAALLLRTGDANGAEHELQKAIFHVPGYARGIAGLGAVAVARGDLKTAERDYADAANRMPLAEFEIALGDVRTALGDARGAQNAYTVVRVEQQLFAQAGGNADMELSLFDAQHPDGAPPADQVVAQARKAVAERPSIFAHDALGWALHRAGDCQGALPEARAANRLGTRSPQLLYHLGAIAACAGQTAEARTALTAALALDPRFSPIDAPAAQALLASLPRA